ncbi:tyrosine-protein phosphatase [Psychromarinibacter sp. C21-152]|uniref:Tyrosine-protein phosphatase n=1 Tax=Psychromarinibacter sediminicola TaxID=3033385 RepID=A0AAE3T7P5_9RHOB|nr:tyrosine-protein phosphatase [Psychromarinibacter sediminicola]MDF0599933.1 tyrosine-protein phosphatase [Psychromarinibacter sediminicola]
MLRQLFRRIHEIERRLSKSFGTDIDTPAGRRAAWWHFHLTDHGILRGLWTNSEEIAPGVWRSNQPSPARLRRVRRRGIATILNLRGRDKFSFYLFEKEACDKLGIELIDHKIYARRLVPAERFLELFEIFDQLEAQKPFLMHCKSGADRAGLAAALWLMDKEGASLAAARRMLSLRYVHLSSTQTGILDHLLDVYAADCAEHPIPIREWFATRYDPAAITASFHAKKGWPPPETA